MHKNILISTGDFSGDVIAGKIVSRLNKNEQCEFYGIGGEEIEKKGVNIIQKRIKPGVSGFTEVAWRICQEKAYFNSIKSFINMNKIHSAILFDNPGFNLPLAKRLYHKGIKVFYFSPPQVWAWGEWRIKYLRDYVYLNLAMLPFEEEYYKVAGVNAIYVGHPAVLIKSQKKEDIIIFMPGSRENEIKQIIPYAGKSINKWAERNQLRLIVSFPPVSLAKEWIKYSKRWIYNAKFLIGKTQEILPKAKIAVICSGVSALESTFSLTPAVVVYRLSPISYFIGKSLLKIRYISLPNILSGKEVQKEVIQYKLNEKNIKEALDYTLKNQDTIIQDYKIIQRKFGKINIYEKAPKILDSFI